MNDGYVFGQHSGLCILIWDAEMICQCVWEWYTEFCAGEMMGDTLGSVSGIWFDTLGSVSVTYLLFWQCFAREGNVWNECAYVCICDNECGISPCFPVLGMPGGVRYRYEWVGVSQVDFGFCRQCRPVWSARLQYWQMCRLVQIFQTHPLVFQFLQIDAVFELNLGFVEGVMVSFVICWANSWRSTSIQTRGSLDDWYLSKWETKYEMINDQLWCFV